MNDAGSLAARVSSSSYYTAMQEDSAAVKQGMSLASVFCMSDRMYQVGHKPLLEVASNPEAQLFLRLESLVPREQLHVKPGRLVIAMYGDNW